MGTGWANVPLGEVLRKSDEWITIEPKATYKEVTVRLWGKGVVQRRLARGSEIASSWRNVVRTNQFILSRIDARNGALGLIPESLDGAVVSTDFPVFSLNEAKMLPAFLNWLSKTQSFIDICKAASVGTTNRIRLKEEKFLEMKLPLPPPNEQQRIVARIEECALKISEAQKLRREANAQCENLCRSIIFDKSISECIPTAMRELVQLRPLDVKVDKNQPYEFAGVYSFGRGVFRGQLKTGAEFAYTYLTRLQTGNFVYPKLMAWEGALGVVPAECNNLVVSPEFPVFEVNESIVLPETLDVYFRTPSVWPQLSSVSTGTNVRRRRLNPKDFLNYKMPLPPMSTQEKLREVKMKVETMKPLQSQIAAELDAMLPAVLDKAFKGEL